MKKNKLITFASALLGVSMSLISVHATAAVVLQGGGITITETNTSSATQVDTGFAGEYIVNNGSLTGLFGFAVSNNSTTSVGTDFIDASDGEGILWDSSIITEADWLTETIVDANFDFVSLLSFGAFTDFFETGDSVNLYSLGETGIINAGATTGAGTFLFNPAILNSSAVVFNVGGGATTLSTVPVPAAAWLFGSGILGLVGVARRKSR